MPQHTLTTAIEHPHASPKIIMGKLLTACALTAVVLAALTLSSTAHAAGNHAGGHGHHGSTTDTAIGQPGIASKVTRTIAIVMNDTMRFTPAAINVKQGETVRLVVHNQGQVKHELSIGTEAELLEHLELMKKFPDMEHDEPNKVTLAPGAKGEIIWHFTRGGSIPFACLIPGHFEAGMRGAINVARP